MLDFFLNSDNEAASWLVAAKPAAPVRACIGVVVCVLLCRWWQCHWRCPLVDGTRRRHSGTVTAGAWMAARLRARGAGRRIRATYMPVATQRWCPTAAAAGPAPLPVTAAECSPSRCNPRDSGTWLIDVHAGGRGPTGVGWKADQLTSSLALRGVWESPSDPPRPARPPPDLPHCPPSPSRRDVSTSHTCCHSTNTRQPRQR